MNKSPTLVLICTYLVLAPVASPFSQGALYDRARLFELLTLAGVILVATLQALSRSGKDAVRLPAPLKGAVPLAIFTLVLTSAAFSKYPFWAFNELALNTLIGLTAFILYWITMEDKEGADRWLAGAILLSAGLFSIAFYDAQLEATEDGWPFEWFSPFVTFSNVRFFSQFQAYTLPLVAIPLIGLKLTRPLRIAAAVIAVCWWALQFMTSTRAIWFAALLTIVFLLVFLRRESTRFLRCQAMLFVAGGITYFLFGTFVFGEAPGLGRLAREGLDSSGRIPLWSAAIEMILDAPLLGVGPLHYGFLHFKIAAHPHNTWLQVAAEYGLPAAMLITYLVFRFLQGAVRYCQATVDTDREINVALLAALVMGLGDSLMSGNTVMPHSQMALLVILGWLAGRNVSTSSYGRDAIADRITSSQRWTLSVIALLAISILAWGRYEFVTKPRVVSKRSFTVAHPRIWRDGHWPANQARQDLGSGTK